MVYASTIPVCVFSCSNMERLLSQFVPIRKGASPLQCMDDPVFPVSLNAVHVPILENANVQDGD